ncbi:MAG: DUF3793 family protein [Clostridia bacterium]|nr:DUF3793 family protein [Clostridia bacterium]
MLDRAIIDHASPTLARLKLGSLFNYPVGEGYPAEFTALRAQLRNRGVTMTVLKVARGKALIYLYRAEIWRRRFRTGACAACCRPAGTGDSTPRGRSKRCADG